MKNEKNKSIGELRNKKIILFDNTKQLKSILDYLGCFLLKNGFKLIEGNNHFANDMCGVVITDENIEVANNDGFVTYSKDHNIYWLIGYLSYFGFISKNYNL